MPITITTAGTYTVVPGETYIIAPSVSGNVNFVPPSGTGTADFTVEVNTNLTNNVAINLNGGTGQTLSPTIKVADGVDAGRLDVTTNTSTNFGNLSYDIGEGSKIGEIEAARGTDTSVVKTNITAGDGATIESINTSTAATNVTLGDNVTITGGLGGSGTTSTGGFTMTTGTGFNYDGGTMGFSTAQSDVSVTIGENSTLNGNTINMNNSGTDYFLSIGSGSSVGNISMAGGFGDKTLLMGDNVTTGSIGIGGSGSTNDFMQITIVAGDGTVIDGNLSLGGSNVDRTVTFGDDVRVDGHFAMGGSAGTNVVTIGDNYTQTGYFTGSTSSNNSSDTIVVGDNWSFGSTFTLQGGDDSLVLGPTIRDASGTMSGGSGTDSIKIKVAPENRDAFATAANNAGWTQLADGSWNTNGRSLTWQGISYTNWETASICLTAGTMIRTPTGDVAINDLKPGDLVVTVDHGDQPIRWIGARKIDAIDLRLHPNLTPVRIKAGALGAGLPVQDLLVSPQHRLLVQSKIAEKMFSCSEVLVAAKHLVCIDGIEIAQELADVEYWHFMCDDHELVFANGARTESLFTGVEALKSVSPAAREEILTIFPDLRDRDPAVRPEGARSLINGRQGRKMAERHAANGKPLVATDHAARYH